MLDSLCNLWVLVLDVMVHVYLGILDVFLGLFDDSLYEFTVLNDFDKHL